MFPWLSDRSARRQFGQQVPWAGKAEAERFGPCFDFLDLQAELSMEGQLSVMSVSPGCVSEFPSRDLNKKVSFMAGETEAEKIKWLV